MKTYPFLFVFLFCLFSVTLDAQINIKGKVKDQTNNRANNKVDQSIDNGLDAVEGGVKDLFKKKKNEEEVEEEQKEEVEQTEEENNEVEVEKMVKPDIDKKPSLTSYSKFDFIPGEKIIFYDDFSQDAVGDFPALWFSNGSGEVVTFNNFPGKWLQLTAEGCYYPERDLQTSENFTVEFDYICPTEVMDLGFYFVSGNIKDPEEGGAIPGKAGVKTSITNTLIYTSSYSDGDYVMDGNASVELNTNEKIHFSYWVQKQRLRIYVNEKKVSDLPRIMPLGYKFNVLRFELGDGPKPCITNFRVAAGLPDTRNKLITEGKLVTYGIYFDVNSDKVKPESYGTLKDIAGILNEVPDVRVKIFGHTDADGQDATNLDLSKRRAASVKNELANSFGVNADRLETDGLGETKPVAPNDTPVNKALNRRVEFIKLNK